MPIVLIAQCRWPLWVMLQSFAHGLFLLPIRERGWCLVGY